MPNLDKTGPEGMGPTGWRQGDCATPHSPRTLCGRPVQGFRGSNRGFRNRDTMTLREEEAMLTERLSEVRTAMKEQEQE